MKKNPIILLLISLLFVGVTSCKKVDPSPTPTITPPTTPTPATSGSANFTKYIAIGNSLTAGLTNGGLYNAGISVSYPNLLAAQFAQAGGGEFAQPLFSATAANGSGFLKLTDFNASTSSFTIVSETSNLGVIGLGADNKTTLLEKYTGNLNNLGVPGLSVGISTRANYGLNNPIQFNPFFERLLGTTDAASSYADFLTAKATDATFFTFWLGNNDALGYATSGGTTALTDAGTFTTNLKTLLDKMGTAKGAIINIPNVTTAAFFKTVTLAVLQGRLQAAGLPANTPIWITPGSGAPRAATAEDLFLLGSQTQYGMLGSSMAGTMVGPYGLSAANPIENQHVLDKDEVAAAQAATAAFNTALQAEATARDLAFVDIASATNLAATTGYTDPVGGLTYSTAFITGGLISLDGLHFTPAGNAVVANEIINAINTKYGATVPLLNPALFNSITIAQQ